MNGVLCMVFPEYAFRHTLNHEISPVCTNTHGVRVSNLFQMITRKSTSGIWVRQDNIHHQMKCCVVHAWGWPAWVCVSMLFRFIVCSCISDSVHCMYYTEYITHKHLSNFNVWENEMDWKTVEVTFTTSRQTICAMQMHSCCGCCTIFKIS